MLIRRSFQLGLAAALAVHLFACKEQSVPDVSVVSDSAGIQIVYTPISRGAPACDASQEVLRIGAISGDSASEFHGLEDAARFGDGRIVVLNAGTQQVKVFSQAGDLMNQFGRRGRGPGEFRTMWSLDVMHGDTLAIADYRPWRFSYFTSTGEFLKAVELAPPLIERPQVAIPLEGDAGFLIGEACCDAENEFVDRYITLRAYTSGGYAADTVGRFRYDRLGPLSTQLRLYGHAIFGSVAGFAHLRDELFVYAPGEHEQFEIWGMDGRRRRIVRWSARDRTVDNSHATAWKRQLLERFPSTPQSKPFIDAQISDDRPVAQSFPSHGAIVVGVDGGIWIKEYTRPSDEGLARWLVFEPEGSLVCQIRLPDGLSIYDAGMDYILGSERNELDVEFLVLRRLASRSPDG
jgi:hypothetical protein